MAASGSACAANPPAMRPAPDLRNSRREAAADILRSRVGVSDETPRVDGLALFCSDIGASFVMPQAGDTVRSDRQPRKSTTNPARRITAAGGVKTVQDDDQTRPAHL